jgi:hypothetical protein
VTASAFGDFFENCIGPHSLEYPTVFWLKKLVVVPTTPTHPTALLATFFLPTDEVGFEMGALC